MMRVFVSSTLPCDSTRAWAAVQTPEVLLEVCRPLVTLLPLPGETFPERWVEGRSGQVRSWLFGLIPFGVRSLVFEKVDQEQQIIQTREHDPLIQKWDHCIRVQTLEPGRCQYSDEVEIDAGILTLPVWLFARVLYSHRHRRWLNVARRLQATP